MSVNESLLSSIAEIDEEMAELTQHLTKCIRNKEQFSNDNLALLEEIADVQICLDNLRIAFDIDDDLLKYIMDIKFEQSRRKVNEGTA